MEASSPQNFALLAQGTLIGGVADTAGNPIPDATVSAGSLAVTTDSGGKYSVKLDPGNYTIVAQARGFATNSIGITIDDGAVVTEDFVLANAMVGEIDGNVSDVDIASGIRNAIVSAGPLSTKTDIHGDYTIENVPGGNDASERRAVDYSPDQKIHKRSRRDYHNSQFHAHARGPRP